MCYYLNVHCQGQRVKISNKLKSQLLKHYDNMRSIAVVATDCVPHSIRCVRQFNLLTVAAKPHRSVVDRWYRPMIKIIRNTYLISIHDFMFGVSKVIGIGNNSAISTSKIMKITAIRKNRDENGSRAELIWVESAFKWGIFFLGLR